MAYNLLGQQGPKGSRNPDPNLTDEQATYLYDNPPGQGDNKGLTAAGKPVDKADVQEKLGEVETVEDEEPTTQPVTTTTPSINQNIKNIQQRLKDLGFNPGPIDGIVGPRTRGAAQDYIDSLSGQEAQDAFNFYNDVLGNLTKPTDTQPTTPGGRSYFPTTPKTATIPWYIQLGYDTEGEAIKDGMSPSDVKTEVNDFSSIIKNIDFGKSVSVDISDEDLRKLQAKESFAKAARGELSKGEFKEFVQDVLTDFKDVWEEDSNVLEKIGAGLKVYAQAVGFTGNAALEVVKDAAGEYIESFLPLYQDYISVPAKLFDGVMSGFTGNVGSTPIQDFIDKAIPDYKWDSVLNRFYNPETNEVLPNTSQDAEEIEAGNVTTPGVTGVPGTTTVIETEEPDLAYNAIGQLGPKGESNEGYEYKFDDPPGKGFNPGVSKIGDPDPEPKATSVVLPDDEATITIYKDGQEKQILESDWSLYEAAGWSRVKPGTAGIGADVDFIAEEDEVGPGQLVSDTLNEFNNVPQNSILIEAGGQLFLGYEVPGAYGQMYNGNPIFMLYEVLGNDVFEAGLLTQGASPQINVSLGSLEDLNQYGIIVGGTDELTDDVEHPFIRFTENFEAGKRVNPWLNDTAINPLSGVTYQQEAIEFLAEQALEQWTPEQTQVRYEGSDWYRKSTTAQKTWLTTLLTQPAQAQQDIQDKQIEVKAAMEANGISSPPDALVAWVADKAVTGMWTQVYTDQQIALLADPYKPGARDTGMVNFIEGVGVGTLDRLSVGEKTVRDLYRRYLGPSLGNASDTEIAEKAGLLRSDPDAEEQLKAYLEQQRLAMFGNYTNPTLTYNDIVQPYKNLVNQVWGQEVDETQDWFIKMVQDNDIEKAYTTLRQKGMEQGIERVQDQALNDLQRGIGQGQVAPELGANR